MHKNEENNERNEDTIFYPKFNNICLVRNVDVQELMMSCKK